MGCGSCLREGDTGGRRSTEDKKKQRRLEFRPTLAPQTAIFVVASLAPYRTPVATSTPCGFQIRRVSPGSPAYLVLQSTDLLACLLLQRLESVSR